LSLLHSTVSGLQGLFPFGEIKSICYHKAYECQVSCYIVWISRKVDVNSATRKGGKDAGRLHPFKILGCQPCHRAQKTKILSIKAVETKNLSRKDVIKKSSVY
jgi:hypothetical protein